MKLTEAEYWQAVNKLRHCDNSHVLLSELEKEFSKWNVIYVLDALKKIQLPDTKPTEAPPEPQKIEKPLNISSDYKNGLIGDMQSLIAQKRRLSNAFWDVQTDKTKCKNISAQILMYENNIEARRERIEYFNLHNMPMPELVSKTDEFDLPLDKYNLEIKKRSIIAMVSQVKRELEQAKLKNDEKKVQDREKRLRELNNQKQLIIDKLEKSIS